MASPKTVLIFVNGILNFPGDSKNWNYRATVWTHLNTEARANCVEYFCGPIGRAFGQRKRAEKITELLQAYAGWEIIMVMHSNGNAVGLLALASELIYPHIQELHMVSAACDADFDRNGLNEALEDGRIGSVSVYVNGKDRALRLASCWFGRLLGYGVLGLHGPLKMSPLARAKTKIFTAPPWVDWGHSDCFRPEHFDRTMKNFTAGLES